MSVAAAELVEEEDSATASMIGRAMDDENHGKRNKGPTCSAATTTTNAGTPVPPPAGIANKAHRIIVPSEQNDQQADDNDDHKNAAAASSGTWEDPALDVLLHVAIFRVVIYFILTIEWNQHLPQEPIGKNPADAWFTYDQFEWIYEHWSPQHDENDNNQGNAKCRIIQMMGTAVGIIAALGGLPTIPRSFQVSGTLMLVLYYYRFFLYVDKFTNHHYLFPMLAGLVVLSGGGSFFSPSSWKKRRRKLGRCDCEDGDDVQLMIRRCEWISVTARFQYAILYFFASLWKLHPDWWYHGKIVEGIFLSFEEQGVARGVPWRQIESVFPQIFVLVALSGLILDGGMFLALTFMRPSPDTSRLFFVLSCLFHGFVCFTMSERIGYTFPAACLAGSVLFRPIGNEWCHKKDDDNPQLVNHVDTNLVGWAIRYVTGNGARASRTQRCFTAAWLLIQLALPLRMPLISKMDFPYSGRCYRFSWTMMLHSRTTAFAHKGMATNPNDGTPVEKLLPFYFLYLIPKCNGPMLRQNYMPESVNAVEDPRTFPINYVLHQRHQALINVFPRYIARVAGGLSEALYKAYPDGCHGKLVSVYGVHFAKLNGRGGWHRMFDPTVNLVASNLNRRNRTIRELWTDVLLDRAPRGRNEYLLTGIGSSRERVEEIRTVLLRDMPEAKGVELLADRAECLAARPFSLWLEGYPIAILPVEVPANYTIYLEGRQRDGGTITPETQWEGLLEPQRMELVQGKQQPIMATSVEIGAAASTSIRQKQRCGDTSEENLIIAIILMA